MNRGIIEKIVAGCAVACILFGVYVYAASSFMRFADYLAQHGVIKERSSEAEYRLGDLVLRQEVAAMALRLNGTEVADGYVCQHVFSDVGASIPNTWVCGVAEVAAEHDIISSSRSEFRPEGAITRAEALAMLWKGICFDLDSVYPGGITFSADTTDWQERVIAAASQYGVSSHTTTFRPNDTATRGEIFVFAKNLHELSVQHNWCGLNSAPTLSGEASSGIQVGQSSNNPSGGETPASAEEAAQQEEEEVEEIEALLEELFDGL